MISGLIERAYAAVTSTEITDAVTVNPSTSTTFVGLVDAVIMWVLYIAGVLAFVYLVISGITFVTAAGNAEQAKKGQQGLIYAIIGILVITLALVLLTATNSLGNNPTTIN